MTTRDHLNFAAERAKGLADGSHRGSDPSAEELGQVLRTVIAAAANCGHDLKKIITDLREYANKFSAANMSRSAGRVQPEKPITDYMMEIGTGQKSEVSL